MYTFCSALLFGEGQHNDDRPPMPFVPASRREPREDPQAPQEPVYNDPNASDTDEDGVDDDRMDEDQYSSAAYGVQYEAVGDYYEQWGANKEWIYITRTI